MTRLLIFGINGAMGNMLRAVSAAHNTIEVIGGVDKKSGAAATIPVFQDADSCTLKADVVIDFSNPASLDGLISYCRRHAVPAVICTTGHDEAQLQQIAQLAQELPVFHSANMSLGVNVIAEIAKIASKALGMQFDIEIVERHHRKKIDAPSGTAWMLAKEINHANADRYRFVCERESRREQRSNDEIGILSLRGGTIVGEHEICFAGDDEVISITHTAYSKRIFAVGAIKAALFLKDKSPGLYTMADLIG